MCLCESHLPTSTLSPDWVWEHFWFESGEKKSHVEARRSGPKRHLGMTWGQFSGSKEFNLGPDDL